MAAGNTENNNSVRMALQTRERVARLAPEALVVIPIGATEQHGPHLPLGTDHLVVDQVAVRAAARLSTELPIVVAPTMPFGYSEHHFEFGPTISISIEVLLGYVCDVAVSLVQSGFRRLFLLNGHGGNADILNLVSRRVSLEHDVLVGAGSYWQIANAALQADPSISALRVPGHAGVFETSIAQACLAASVDTPPKRTRSVSEPANWDQSYRTDHNRLWRAGGGFTDNPAEASAEIGERILAIVEVEVARALTEFCSTVE